MREQSYEKPIAAGQWRYEQNGTPTGAVESWRLTQPTDGIEVLRVDLDARSALSGHSYLYHLIRQDSGARSFEGTSRLERLNYRFWGDGLQIEGTLLFEESGISNLRTVNGTTYEEEIKLSSPTPFWFPSSTGLGLLANLESGAGLTAVTLNSSFDKPNTVFQLQTVTINVSNNDKKGTVQVVNREHSIRPLTISWPNQTRTIWLNEQNWPLKIERGDGLTAVETRYIQYQRP